MPDPGPSDSATINEATAARLLQISPRMLRHLVGKGWIPRHSRGRYTVVGVVHGYIAYRDHLDEKRTGTAADSDLRRAKQREIEQRMAIRDLMDIVEHDAVFDEAIGMLKAELIGLPARITRNIEFRRLVTTLQWLTIIPMALQPISRWFCEAAYLAGTLPVPFVPVDWDPPEFESINPIDDANTDTAGLVFDIDPRKVSRAGLTQGRAPGTKLPDATPHDGSADAGDGDEEEDRGKGGGRLKPVA